MAETVVEWMEKEIDGTPRRRAFKCDGDTVLDYHNDEVTNKIPVSVLASLDVTKMTDHAAKKIVKFCKAKVGVV